MKIVFEAYLDFAKRSYGSVELHFAHVDGDTSNKLVQFEGKYVHVTVEEIKQTVKNETPVCYAAMPV